jgi:hypothetical protein
LFNLDDFAAARRKRTRATAFLSRLSTLARRFGMAATRAARMAFSRARIAARRTFRSAVVIRGVADVARRGPAVAAAPRGACAIRAAVKFFSAVVTPIFMARLSSTA